METVNAILFKDANIPFENEEEKGKQQKSQEIENAIKPLIMLDLILIQLNLSAHLSK